MKNVLRIVGIVAAASFTLAGCSSTPAPVQSSSSSPVQASSGSVVASSATSVVVAPPVTVTAAPPVTVTAAPPVAVTATPSATRTEVANNTSFIGNWDTKFSHLEIDPAGTGTLTLTVPCCISAAFPIQYVATSNSLSVTVTGPPIVQGNFSGDLPEGTEIAFRWAEGFEGQILTGLLPGGTENVFLCSPATPATRQNGCSP